MRLPPYLYESDRIGRRINSGGVFDVYFKGLAAVRANTTIERLIGLIELSFESLYLIVLL